MTAFIWVVVAGLAQADDSALMLETGAAYRGFFAQNEWQNRADHLTDERLYAALDSFLVERAFAAYNVGFGLDHTMRWDTVGRRDTLGYEYDGRLNVLKDSDTPMSIYASRQSLGTSATGAPSAYLVSEIAGFNAAMQPVNLPKLRARGYMRSRESEDAAQGLAHQTSRAIDGALSHSDNRLLAVGEVKYRQDRELYDATNRQFSESRLFASYKLDDDLALTARGRARSYTSDFDGRLFDLDTLSSDADLRWTPSRTFQGTAFTRATRNSQGDGIGSSDFTMGTTGRWFSRERVTFLTALGANSTRLDLPGEEQRFVGEYAQSHLTLRQPLEYTNLQLDTQAGVAAMTEVGVGTGAQGGLGTEASVFQTIKGSRWVLSGSAEIGRQWDTSPRDLDYVSGGWSAGATSRRVGGPNLMVRLDQYIVSQLSIDEGNSNRLRGHLALGVQPQAPLSLTYGFSAYRDVLDGQFSKGLANTARAGFSLPTSLTAGAVYQHSLLTSNELPTLWTHRADLTLTQRIRLFELTARASTVYEGGRVPRSLGALVWLEVTQKFGIPL